MVDRGEVRINIQPSIKARILNPLSFKRKFRDAQDEVGRNAVLILKGHARKSTGRMAAGIQAKRVGGVIIISTATAVSDRGFPYLAITRFGHKKAWIYPRPDRNPNVTVLDTKKKRGTVSDGRAALRFTRNGVTMYRKKTRGFRPTYDWVTRGETAVIASANITMGKLARRL